MDLIVEVWLLVPAMEISNDISDSWETNTGILGLWECLLAEVLGWLKHRTLGALSSRRGQEKHIETALSCGGFMFSALQERTGGDGGWDGGKRREKAVRTKFGFFVLGPVGTF